MEKNRPQSRKRNLVEQEVDGELLIYDLESNKAFCLNQASSLIWQACDGNRTVAQINDLLGKQLQARTDEDIVWLALDQLSKENLIDPPVDLETKFAGMSRRQVIKKIGVGSMIALPMVASLVAPTAIHAQSGQLAPGAFSGNATIPGGNCGNPLQGVRDAACQSQTGLMCTSLMAAQQQPGVCTAGPTTTFSCACIP